MNLVPLLEPIFLVSGPAIAFGRKWGVEVWERGTEVPTTVWASEDESAELAQPLTTDDDGRPKSESGLIPWVKYAPYDLAYYKPGEPDKPYVVVPWGPPPSTQIVVNRYGTDVATPRGNAEVNIWIGEGTPENLADNDLLIDLTGPSLEDISGIETLALKSEVEGLLGIKNAFVFKGVIDCSSNPNFPAADAGHTYKVSVAGKIGGGSGQKVEVGDTLYCYVDGSAAGTQAAVGGNWAVIQGNTDGVVTGPEASVSGNLPTFEGVSGKVLKDSGIKPGTAASKDAGAAGETGKLLNADDPVVVKNVKSYGAKGDGTTDDAAAIREAIKAASETVSGVVLFPKGTYRVASNLTLKSNVELRGEGRGATTIKADAGVTSAVLVGTEPEDLVIRDLTIDGNAAAFSSNVSGISLTKAKRVKILNARIKNTYHIGIVATECTDLAISENLLSECGRTSTSPNAINVSKGTRVRVTLNTITDWGNGGNGRAIFTNETPAAQVMGNNVANPGNVSHSHMIAVENSDRALITDNQLDNSAYTGEARKCMGISVVNSNDALIASNRILQPSQDKGSLECIQIDGTSARATVTGNHCERGDDNGITAWGVGEHVISGNLVIYAAHHGISVNSPNCTVTGNLCKNSGQHPEIVNPSGIGVYTGITGTVILGNRCFDDQEAKTQLWGVVESGTANENTILGNDLRGNKEGAVSYVGANTVLGANQGLTPRKGETEIHDIGSTAFADSVAPLTPVNGTVLFRSDAGQVAVRTGTNIYTQLAKDRVSTLTDGATVTPNYLNGNHFILVAKGSRTIANVTNRLTGVTITLSIKNETGGAMTTTWNEAFKLAGAWVDPANGKKRTITFYCTDGTNWEELSRSAADI